ncbi:hypothetical protein D9M69_702370 [compost metagenome]
MRFVDELLHPLAQSLEGRLLDFFLIAAGLEVAPREQADQIRQASTIEASGKGHAQHV